MTEPVFVFGSNLAGRHGKGAAKFAMKERGAVYGQGQGLQGNSYAIPTKDERLRVLPLDRIQKAVDNFKIFALYHPEMRFQITPVGCGLAGYSYAQIAPMFIGAPDNCDLPAEFLAVINPVVTVKPLLIQCPFCGSQTARHVSDNVDLGYMDHAEYYAHTVVCNASPQSGGCGATCGYHDTPEEAVKAWNQRAEE